MKISHIAFFVLCVSDMARSKGFYEDVLGLTPLDNDFGSEWVEYDVSGMTFAITTKRFPDIPTGNNGGIAFEVDDVDAWVEKCKAAGVTVKLPGTEFPTCYSAFLMDPDNNTVALHKIKT